MKLRIISNGSIFKPQYKKSCYPFWITFQRPVDPDNKDFGGDVTFYTKQEAQKFIDSKKTKSWAVV